MTNPYYNPTGNPANQARALAASVRSELALIAAGFALLPIPGAIQGGQLNYLVDSGNANAYVVAPNTGVITALTDGLYFQIKIGNANTGAATLTLTGVPGAAAVPIVRYDGSALLAGDIPAGGIVPLTYSSTLGKWQLYTAGAVAAASSAATAASSAGSAAGSASSAATSATNAATSAAQAAASASQGLAANGVTLVTSSVTLAGSVLGGTVILNAAGATTQTLPAASSAAAGRRIEFLNTGAGTATIQRAGTDNIGAGNSLVTSLTVNSGGTLALESNGVNEWYAVGGTAILKSAAVFGASLAGSGYQKLPSGLIVQWGATTSDATGTAGVTFPIAFPSSSAPSVTTCPNVNGFGTYSVNLATASLTGMTLKTTNASAGVPLAFSWMAIGY